MEKIRYEVDPHNRLVARGLGVKRFRTVLDGSFKVDEGNKLFYHVKKSSGIDMPQEIKFSGNWSLDDEHSLVLTLDKWNNQIEGNKLVLQGELMDAKASELVYSVATRETSQKERIYIVKLGGKWQADKYNRLCFDVEKENGAADELTLRGSWNINKKNEIVYTYKQARLKTKERSTSAVAFRGRWDITDKDRLSYVFNQDIGSSFDFRVTFEKALKDGLRFSLGVGVVPQKKRMTLFGGWKFKKGLGLNFEAESNNGRPSSINFSASYLFSQEQGEAFLKLLASKKEVSFVVGAGFRW